MPPSREMLLQTDRFLGRRDIADRLARALGSGHGGQPFLFVGPDGSGKEATALELARRINCTAPDSCRDDAPCESCLKARTFQHPDIHWVGPAPAGLEDPGKSDQVRAVLEAKIANPFDRPDFAASSQILIGNPDHPGTLTIRSLMRFLRRQSFQGRWKVAVVSDAHRMNNAAANAFLKTLEEPPPASLIILTTTSTASLLPTILSRCQKVLFEPYPEGRLVEILETLAPQIDANLRAEAVRLADGNARKAMALLGPETQALRRWAEAVFTALSRGRSEVGQLAAEQLHAGALPVLDDTLDLDASRLQVSDMPARRQRALLFCETLELLFSETVACRERGDQWRPRAAAAASLVREAAAGRDTGALLADIARVERAKHEIDGNLNIGLTMAVMMQDLGTHDRPE